MSWHQALSKLRSVRRLRQRCELAALLGAALGVARPVAAEVPKPPEHGREFRVDFSARHLEVDAELGELSLSGDVELTVGRYRLGGNRVRLKRGPRGIGVEGGGDIAFCACDNPPVTLGYASVTIAPPSDVLVKNAVLRAGGVPVFWLPYLWLRSPDRLALMFPSVEWRGDDGLLLGSGVHVPFEANQGRPAARALDIGGYGYVSGGARVDARFFTPETTSFIRWDYKGGTALSVDAHGAAAGKTKTTWAYDADASLGARGRTALSSLEAAARRYDHARFGVGSSAGALVAFGLAFDAQRGAWFSDPLSVGPFALFATGGALGQRSSYTLDLGASSVARAGDGRRDNAETRGLQRLGLESAYAAGPVLARVAAFEQGELLSQPAQTMSTLRAGAGLSLSTPLLRRFESLSHVIAPELSGRAERQFLDWDAVRETRVIGTAGFSTALGTVTRGAAARLRVAGGMAGDPAEPTPVTLAALSADTRLLGMRLSGVAEPDQRAAEATARLRLGARGATNVSGYAEARTERAPSVAAGEAQGDLLPPFHALGAYDREGLTTGGDLTFALASVLSVGGGVDVDPLVEKLLSVRSFARYRHGCGCVALGAFASRRTGRGGGDSVDAGISLDLMP